MGLGRGAPSVMDRFSGVSRFAALTFVATVSIALISSQRK